MSKDLMNTIVDVYAAPGSADGWDSAIGSIGAVCGGKSAGYFLVNDQDSELLVSSSYGIPPHIAKYYELKGQELDVRFKYIHNLKPGRVFREFEFGPSQKEWDESEWVQYHYRESGVYYWMGAKVSTHGLWSDYVAVNKLKTLGPVTDREKQILQDLLPHLARAAELHKWVADLQARYQAVLSVLDKLLVGLVILDKKGRIAAANIAAKAIASESGAYQLGQGGRLRLVDTDADLSARKLIEQTTITSTTGGHNDGGQIIVSNRSSGDDILLEFIPIRDDGFSDRDNIQGTAVFVMDPSRSQTFSSAGLKNLFKLTDSESEVVDSLINGLSVNDIADDRRTNADTVRRQLKSVFSKTGTNGQLDLLRKAVKANPPIADKPRT